MLSVSLFKHTSHRWTSLTKGRTRARFRQAARGGADGCGEGPSKRFDPPPNLRFHPDARTPPFRLNAFLSERGA